MAHSETNALAAWVEGNTAADDDSHFISNAPGSQHLLDDNASVVKIASETAQDHGQSNSNDPDKHVSEDNASVVGIASKTDHGQRNEETDHIPISMKYTKLCHYCKSQRSNNCCKTCRKYMCVQMSGETCFQKFHASLKKMNGNREVEEEEEDLSELLINCRNGWQRQQSRRCEVGTSPEHGVIMPPRKAAQKKPARKESKKKLKIPSNKTSQMKEKTPRKAPQRNLEGPSSKLENNTKAVVLRSPKILDSNSKYVARRRPMLCMICKKNFRSKKMLDDHYAKHHFFRHCPNCPKTFQSTRAYILHLRSHLADYPYECKICLIGFNKKADLILHKKKGHITNDEYGCDKCANVFPTVFCRNRHRMTHRPPPYGCDCGASFSNIPDKLVHRKNHVHRCILCPKEVVAFPSNYDLLKHIYEVHPPKKSNDENNGVDLVEPCISNGVVRLEDDGESDSMDDLLSSSDDESPSDVDSNYDFDAVRPVYDLKRKNRFICFICYNLYPSSELLKTHMKAHKWYPCNSCPKFFANAEALEKHECRVAEVPELECHVVEVPSCKICNTECQKCKKNVDPGVNIPENGLSTPEFPGVPELPIFNYYDINVRNWVCNLIQYVKSVKGPIDFQSVAHMFAHTTNLQVILEYPPLRQLFPNECILEIEELYSQCLDLSYTLWNRMNR